MGRLEDKIGKLRSEVEALTPKTRIWNGEVSEEEISYWEELISRWQRGEDLSGADPEDTRLLDEYGPIAFAVCDEKYFDGTTEEYARYYLTPRAAESRRKRIEARRDGLLPHHVVTTPLDYSRTGS